MQLLKIGKKKKYFVKKYFVTVFFTVPRDGKLKLMVFIRNVVAMGPEDNKKIVTHSKCSLMYSMKRTSI